MGKLDPQTAACRADATMVLRALRFAAVNDVRYYLNGVCIQPSKAGGVLIIGTDGASALVLHDAKGTADKEYILPLSRQKHARVLGPRQAKWICVHGNVICTVDAGHDVNFISPDKPIDARFPDLAKAMPALDEMQPGIALAIDPTKLRRAFEDSPTGKWPSLRFYSAKERPDERPLLFTVQGGFGLLMPMREPQRTLHEKIPVDFHKEVADA